MSVILGGLGILSEWCQFYLKSFLGCISEREVRQQMLKFGVLNMEGGVPWWVCGCGRSTLQIFKGPLRISMAMCEVHLIINWGICTILSSTPLYFYFSGWRCWQPHSTVVRPFLNSPSACSQPTRNQIYPFTRVFISMQEQDSMASLKS